MILPIKDKPRPMHLLLRTSDVDNLFRALKVVDRPKFIGICKYNGSTYSGALASYFVVKLTNEEALLLSLTVDMKVTKLPKRVDAKFTQGIEDHFFE